MNCVVLESPYGAPTYDVILENVKYAKMCVRDCLLRGEAPIASHLLFTRRDILDDKKPDERALGIKAGLAWLPRADYSVYYTDRGWSVGMLSALHEYSLKLGHDFRIRGIYGVPVLPAALDEDVEQLLTKHMECFR